METSEINTLGKLATQPKSYIVEVTYKKGWSLPTATIRYHYHSVEEATAHLDWVADQIRGQNGKGVKRKNVVVAYFLEERLRSKKLDKTLAPIARFVPPKDRYRPEGGQELLPELRESSDRSGQTPCNTGSVALVRVK